MKKYFIAGLIVLLPLAITYLIFKLIVNTITGPFEDFVNTTLIHYNLLKDGWGIFSHAQIITALTKTLIVIALVLFVFIVGVIGRWVVLHSFWYVGDKAIRKIPFVNKIYMASKDFTTALFCPKSESFSQVVLVPFPSINHLCIGLVTSEFKTEALGADKKEFISVLIPGTPNPTIGFLLIFTRQQVINVDIKVDEAIKYIMTCGSVLPKHMVDSLLLNKSV